MKTIEEILEVLALLPGFITLLTQLIPIFGGDKAAALTVALAAVSHPDMKPAVAVLLKASLVAASQSL